MLLHPKTLELLASFKMSSEELPSQDLLTLLLDNTSRISITRILNILYSYKKDFKDKSLKEVGEELALLIKRSFVKRKCKGGWTCFSKTIPLHLEQIVFTGRRDEQPEALGSGTQNLIDQLDEADSEGETLADPPGSDICEDREPQGDVFAFYSEVLSDYDVKRKRSKALCPQRILMFERIEHETAAIGKFAPIKLKDATFVYDRNNIVLETQRKRKDLLHPVKLQFIKHYDQRRPPIYRKLGTILRHKYSYEQIPDIASYDEDSSEEWVPLDSLEVIGSDEESLMTEVDETEDVDWIEKDSSSDEPLQLQRKTRGPYISYEPWRIERYA